MMIKRAFKCWPLLLDDGDAFGETGGIAALRQAGLHVVLKAKQRGDKPGAVLLHELGSFFVEHSAVLNGIYAGANGGFDTFGAIRVSHTCFSSATGNFDGLGHLLLAQFLHSVVTDGIHNAAAGHELDPVGAEFNVTANGDVDLVDGVGHVWRAWERFIGREQIGIAMTAGERDEVASGHYAWAADQSSFDAVAQRELAITNIGLAGIAQRSEAVVEPDGYIVHAPDGGLAGGHA